MDKEPEGRAAWHRYDSWLFTSGLRNGSSLEKSVVVGQGLLKVRISNIHLWNSVKRLFTFSPFDDRGCFFNLILI